MEPSCVRQTLLPGTTKLFGDYLYNFSKVATYYSGDHSDPSTLIDSAKAVQFPPSRRAQIVNALSRQNTNASALDKLSRPDTVAVVTGQQVGLFSGPAYTIFKAVTAVNLARWLDEQGIPAVPVFWLATEDHDFEEVDHAWVFGPDATPRELKIRELVSNGGPVGCIPLNEIPTSDLREALGGLPFAAEVIEKVQLAYREGNTLGSAFREFLSDILAPFSLLFLDPLLPEMRGIAAPFLSEVTSHVPALTRDLRERSNELERAGYHAQVHIESDASLLFLLEGGRRLPLRWKDGSFYTKDRSFSPDDLKTRANQLSPNALLRPVMQDFLLPTATYVGGPAEIAYLAQSQVLYKALLGRMPLIFPRKSFTLLDARANKLLHRYEVHMTDLLDYQEKVRSRLSAKLVPDYLAADFVSLRSSAAAALGKLQASLREFDPTLCAAASKSAAKILYQINKLSQKTAREAMRRDKKAESDAAYLTNLVYPRRHLQERIFSIVPFLAKHGMDLPERLLELAQLSCHDHMVRIV